MEAPAESNAAGDERLPQNDSETQRWLKRRRRLGNVLSIIVLTISAGLIVFGLCHGEQDQQFGLAIAPPGPPGGSLARSGSSIAPKAKPA